MYKYRSSRCVTPCGPWLWLWQPVWVVLVVGGIGYIYVVYCIALTYGVVLRSTCEITNIRLFKTKPGGPDSKLFF